MVAKFIDPSTQPSINLSVHPSTHQSIHSFTKLSPFFLPIDFLAFILQIYKSRFPSNKFNFLWAFTHFSLQPIFIIENFQQNLTIFYFSIVIHFYIIKCRVFEHIHLFSLSPIHPLITSFIHLFINSSIYLSISLSIHSPDTYILH